MPFDIAALAEKYVLSYLESHPEIIEKVIHALLDRLVAQITK